MSWQWKQDFTRVFITLVFGYIENKLAEHFCDRCYVQHLLRVYTLYNRCYRGYNFNT